MLYYKKGRFTENYEVIIYIGFSIFLFNYINKSWKIHLNKYLSTNTKFKYKIAIPSILDKILSEKVIFLFDSENEMIQNKNNTIDFMKKAIVYTNEKLLEESLAKKTYQIEAKKRKNNIKKINEHFDDEMVDMNNLITYRNVIGDSIIDVMTADGKTRNLISLVNLKKYMLDNPNYKLEKATQNLARVEQIKQALDVNALDPFWFDQYGKLQLNSDYLKSNNKTSNDILDVEKNKKTEIYTVQYDKSTEKYHVFDPIGEQLAVSFTTKQSADEFANLLEYQNSRTIRKVKL